MDQKTKELVESARQYENKEVTGQAVGLACEAIADLRLAVLEQDKRARHAEQELGAFDKRIAELEIENNRLTKAVIEFTDLFGSGNPLTYQKAAAGVLKLRDSIIVQSSPARTR